MWEHLAVTSCMEIDFGSERGATGIKYLAAGSDEQVCGDTCDAESGCGTTANMLVYTVRPFPQQKTKLVFSANGALDTEPGVIAPWARRLHVVQLRRHCYAGA